jgi:hypothetical protein
MLTEKGPIAAIEVLADGIVDLVIAPIGFAFFYILRAVMLPLLFLSAFFDFSTP